MSPSRVLVVDDEPAIVNFIATLLRRRGYEVYTATDGGAAMVLAKELSCGLNLLVTDIVMPDMRGDELIGAVRRICPYIDVLVITGALEESSPELPNCRYLRKPFPPDLLLRAVRDIVEYQLH